MEENIDVTRELQLKNQEMLLNKKKIDLDTSMESLLVFYSNYLTNIAVEVNNKICQYHEIEPNSEQGKIFYNTIMSFFIITSKKLDEIVKMNIEPIKSNLVNLTDKEYIDLLNKVSIKITDELLNYYNENINMLCSELNQDINEALKKNIERYLFDIMTIKMINMLKDKLMFSIRVISNNYEKNAEIIENINEKTLR